jgi:hypothetical protein
MHSRIRQHQVTKGEAMRKVGCTVSLAILAVLVGVSASAHHSGTTYFDLSRTIEHSNVTVVSYDLVNPHGRLVYVFTDEAGNKVEWGGELPAANNVRRGGLGDFALKPGQKLTSVTGSPSRSGSKFMRLDRVVFENGDIAQITGKPGIVRAGAQ